MTFLQSYFPSLVITYLATSDRTIQYGLSNSPHCTVCVFLGVCYRKEAEFKTIETLLFRVKIVLAPLKPLISQWSKPGGGGHSNFFSGRGVRPGFPKCGACELAFASEKGGLWAENFQIWGLVSWKFPNLGACELKFSKFGGLWAKIWVKNEAVEAKISQFSQKGSCELTLLLEMGPLRAAGEAWKGGLQGRTSPYHLSRSVPPRGSKQKSRKRSPTIDRPPSEIKGFLCSCLWNKR